MISVFLKMFKRILLSDNVFLVEGGRTTSNFSEAVGKTEKKKKTKNFTAYITLVKLLFIAYNLVYHFA
jgi:hypothetical protein